MSFVLPNDTILPYASQQSGNAMLFYQENVIFIYVSDCANTVYIYYICDADPTATEQCVIVEKLMSNSVSARKPEPQSTMGCSAPWNKAPHGEK